MCRLLMTWLLVCIWLFEWIYSRTMDAWTGFLEQHRFSDTFLARHSFPCQTLLLMLPRTIFLSISVYNWTKSNLIKQLYQSFTPLLCSISIVLSDILVYSQSMNICLHCSCVCLHLSCDVVVVTLQTEVWAQSSLDYLFIQVSFYMFVLL